MFVWKNMLTTHYPKALVPTVCFPTAKEHVYLCKHPDESTGIRHIFTIRLVTYLHLTQQNTTRIYMNRNSKLQLPYLSSLKPASSPHKDTTHAHQPVTTFKVVYIKLSLSRLETANRERDREEWHCLIV